MYALAITLLIDQLRASCPEVQQAWCADDATGASTCGNLRLRWKEFFNCGPFFGYHPSALKTYLVVKQEYEDLAKNAFTSTAVHITICGK